MKADDLDLLDLLEHNPKAGSIRFKDRRILLWDADAFGTLRQELIESIGLERARPILRRFGFANGYRDALTTGEMFQWDNEVEWWLSCPALQNRAGKVNPSPEHLVINRDDGVFEMEVVWTHSYEAEQHRRVFGHADHPVCWTLAGYASGFSSALMGEEVFVVEEQCAAMGADSCRVVGRTKRAWGDQVEEHAAEYQAQNLTADLEARESELRKQRLALRRKERELAQLRGDDAQVRGGMVCKSVGMTKALQLAETVAKVDMTALITGESGVGKELCARFVHDESGRVEGPFVAINCGALPEQLLESELFGHVRGAFTGANADKRGLFDAARGGTIFLDEVGETAPSTQVKLLRVLQEREIRPVGSTQSHPIDVRVVAATNRDLAAMVDSGEFRKDLYYRLRVVAIDLPPLRERADDVLPLARHFITQVCNTYGLDRRRLSPEAMEALTGYVWPGNVRELQNAIERAVVLSGEGTKIERDHLPAETLSGRNGNGVSFNDVMPMADMEKAYILKVLEHFQGNRTHTARALQIGTNTLWRKLKAWGVPPAR